MKVLWICGLPFEVQETILNNEKLGAVASWSWVLGHFPPPEGIELHVACPVTKGSWKNRSFQYRGVTFHLIRTLPGRMQTGFLLDPWLFLPLYRRLKPDVVHGWGNEDSFSIIARFLSPRRHVVQVQGVVNVMLKQSTKSNFHTHYRALRERISFRKAHTVFVESQYSADMVQPYCGSHTKVSIVDQPLRESFITASVHNNRSKIVIFLARLVMPKGCYDAIEAFAKSAPPDWRFIMIGGGAPTVTQELQNLANKLGIGDRFEMTGQVDVDGIVELMKEAQIFLLPSYQDTGPTSLKEALAMGLWPVCYDNSGPGEFIRRFEYGSLAEDRSIDDLSRVLKEVFADEPWQDEERRAAVMQRVRHELGHEQVWGTLLREYEEVIERARKS